MTYFKITLWAVVFSFFSANTVLGAVSLNVDNQLTFGSKVGYNLANRYMNVKQGLSDDLYVLVNTNIPFNNGNGMASINIKYWGYENNWEASVGWFVYGGTFYRPNCYGSGIKPPQSVKLINKNGRITIAIPNKAFSQYGSLTVSKEVGGINYPPEWEKKWSVDLPMAIPSGYSKDVIVKSSGDGISNNFSTSDLIFNADRVHDLNGNDLSVVGGNVGVGTSSPTAKLHLVSPGETVLKIESKGVKVGPYTSYLSKIVFSGGDTFDSHVIGRFGKPTPNGGAFGFHNGTRGVYVNNRKTVIGISTPENTSNFIEEIKLAGSVAVTGTSHSYGDLIVDKELRVGKSHFRVDQNGNAWATKLTIEVGPFPDYVFSNRYKLMKMEDLKSYINSNRKLPNMPSANDVKTKGVEIGELSRLQQEKIEELTLYILELNERLNELEKTK